MKVLFLHNYYRHRGGEDLSFESEVKLLRDYGHEVIEFVVYNDELKDNGVVAKLRTAADTIWNRKQKQQIQAIIADRQPDIMHCNNIFPQLSVSVYSAARQAKLPIVQALRNYRAICVNSFLFRDARVCTDCLGKRFAWDGIRHKCYRDSRLASTVVAAMQVSNRWQVAGGNGPDLYFTPSAFARQVYLDHGFLPESVMVKPNFIDPDPGMGNGKGGYAIFIGRLSPEKGLDTLIRAWQTTANLGPLKIVGDGPLRQAAEAQAVGNRDIEFLGQQSHDQILQLVGDARVLIMPSQWFETFGRTIAEAYSRGVPVIASRLGAMAELVETGRTGFLFESSNHQDLAKQVARYNSLSDLQRENLRLNARQRYLELYTRAATYQIQMEIYETAIQRSGLRTSSGLVVASKPRSTSDSRMDRGNVQ